MVGGTDGRRETPMRRSSGHALRGRTSRGRNVCALARGADGRHVSDPSGDQLLDSKVRAIRNAHDLARGLKPGNRQILKMLVVNRASAPTMKKRRPDVIGPEATFRGKDFRLDKHRWRQTKPTAAASGKDTSTSRSSVMRANNKRPKNGQH